MATGTQLRDLIRGVRAEAGYSLNESHGQNMRETIVYLLQSTQRRLWYEHDWPLYVVWRDLTFQAGDRYINYPDDMDAQRVNRIAVTWNSRWQPLDYGIRPEHLNQYNSDADERSSPIRRWDHYLTVMQVDQVGQIELWPISSEDGLIRVWGHQQLLPLINDADYSTLDGDMLVMYVAGALLARSGQQDADLKLRQADARRRSILSQTGSDRERMTVYGGSSRPTYRGRNGIDYVTKGIGT